MKKVINLLKVMISVLVLASCSNGSSGTQMLNLGDVRIVCDDEGDNSNKDFVACKELLMDLFTVLPGPYEFTWTELKQDGFVGYEQCRTQLKIKLKLNKSLNSACEYYSGKPLSEQVIMKALEKPSLQWFSFEMLNAEGKTMHDDNSMLFLKPDLFTLWGADGKISFKDNTDGVLDFYHFLISDPGTEYELVLDCGIYLCKEIENVIEFNKGMKVVIKSGPVAVLGWTAK